MKQALHARKIYLVSASAYMSLYFLQTDILIPYDDSYDFDFNIILHQCQGHIMQHGMVFDARYFCLRLFFKNQISLTSLVIYRWPRARVFELILQVRGKNMSFCSNHMQRQHATQACHFFGYIMIELIDDI